MEAAASERCCLFLPKLVPAVALATGEGVFLVAVLVLGLVLERVGRSVCSESRLEGGRGRVRPPPRCGFWLLWSRRWLVALLACG